MRYFSQNSWDCGCRATPFKLWLYNGKNFHNFQRLSDIDEVSCASPSYMTNFTLDGLDYSWFPKTSKAPCKAPVCTNLIICLYEFS